MLNIAVIQLWILWRCNDGCYDARHGSCHGCAVLARSTGSFTVVQSFGAVVTQIWSAVCTVGARGCSRNCGGGAAVAFIHGGQVQQLLRNEDEGCCDGHGGSWFCAVASMEVGHDKCSEAWRLERWHYHGGRSSASEVMVKVRITAMTGSSPATSGAMVTARSTGSFTVVQSFGAVVTQIWSAVCTVGARGCSRNCGGGAAVAFIHGGQVQQLLRNEDEGCCDGHGGSWFCAVASMEVGHDKCSEAWRLERWHYHGGRSSASEVMVKVRITAMTGSSPATSGAMVTGDG
ncbi:hypothetical protein DEO72_LG7g778 [Vigna unguiculata]|uniref:Uncharacterized protein n=1 Tax=Vigna unguiculata TaxID=3917 RepID=A0A4D6MHL8_VIGUN|nr:hypothetical protein DEO72_LG7g778 [Vigna unguiculata]